MSWPDNEDGHTERRVDSAPNEGEIEHHDNKLLIRKSK